MANSSTETQSKPWIGRNRRVLLVGGPVLLLAAIAFFYLTGGRYVSTDDAYIQAARVDISTEVSGRIRIINVRDNQHVKKGDVLFELDTPRFQIAVQDARAQLAAAMLKVPALKAAYRQRLADAAAARSTLAFQQRDLERQTELQAQGISSRAQLDQARNDFPVQRTATRRRRAANRQRACRSGRQCRRHGGEPAPRAPGASQSRPRLAGIVLYRGACADGWHCRQGGPDPGRAITSMPPRPSSR